MKLSSIIAKEFSETIRRPSRLLNVLRIDRLKRFINFQRVRLLSRETWSRQADSLSARQLGSYEDYLQLQRSKLEYLELGGHEARFRTALRERLRDLEIVERGWRVLCLGARLGGEVAAFRDLGCFAFGVDLNPGPDNPWVLYGDFHKLEYPNHCVDAMYSNSLDHCLEPDKVLSEVKRLLKPGGHLVIEADPGVDDPNGIAPDMWATFQWSTVDALKRSIELAGLEFISGADFEYPRNGTRLLFKSPASDELNT